VNALRPAPVEEHQAEYGVAWRDRDGRIAVGSLVLEGAALVLRGSSGGAVLRERVPLERIAAVRIGRAEAERVRGERSVVLELRGGPTLQVAPLGAAGAVFELADLLAELSAQAAVAPAPTPVLLVLPLRPGAAERACELVAGGPPFDLEQAGLDRHQVFTTEREVVFLFEGEHAREAVERLVRDPQVLREAVRWRACLAGRPRLAEETYAWQRGD
jgi:hypothetical protein